MSTLVSVPGRDVDVFEQAGEPVHQRDTQGAEQVVPAGLHVLRRPALGHVLTADVLVAGRHHVRDEVVIPAGRLEEHGTDGSAPKTTPGEICTGKVTGEGNPNMVKD